MTITYTKIVIKGYKKKFINWLQCDRKRLNVNYMESIELVESKRCVAHFLVILSVWSNIFVDSNSKVRPKYLQLV